MALYHSSIGFPATMRNPKRLLFLKYGEHAAKAAQDDRYGTVPLPTTLNTTQAELIEAELDAEGNIVKAVWRMRATTELDVVLVVQPFDAKVRTVWFNHATDTHSTLDESRYARP